MASVKLTRRKFKSVGTAESEITAARDSLDLTLAVYNQAQLIYPVHQSFVELQKSLEGFRDALADVRDVIEPYPGRFNDALTITCQWDSTPTFLELYLDSALA